MRFDRLEDLVGAIRLGMSVAVMKIKDFEEKVKSEIEKDLRQGVSSGFESCYISLIGDSSAVFAHIAITTLIKELST